jgi:outer membrane lipoprotein-sorting protein
MKSSIDLVRVCTGICLTTFSFLADCAEWKLPELMQLLAQQKSGSASFVERKFVALLDRPLESSGELAFIAPDRLEKKTMKPKKEFLVLEGDKLSVDRPDKRRVSVSLQDHPEVAAFVESIRATLAGDLVALEKYYTLAVTGSAEKWNLTLSPTQAPMLAIVSRIRMSGTHGDVKLIEFEQADGDRSEMTITKIVAQ